MKSSIGKASFQQPYDFFLAILAVVVSTLPVVDPVRFVPQEAVDKSFGPLGFDEGDESPDFEIVRGAMHVLATRKLNALPTPLQAFSDATVSLIAHFTSGTQAGRILAEITFCSQMTHTAHQTAVRDTVYKRLFVHWMGLLVTADFCQSTLLQCHL
jgi:hypothetical protein